MTLAQSLTCENLTVAFEGLTALSDVSLSLARGEVLGLIGPNGAGKSTLVNCLSGFQKPTSGRVLVRGSQTASWSVPRFRQAGVARTFQAVRLFSGTTVYENVETTALALGLGRRAAREKVWEVLELTGIADKANQRAADLPYTDERRVGIARAMVLRTDFLLLDEPAAGMTNIECDHLMALISELPGRFGCGILLIEHNMRVVMNLCDRIHVLATGRTLASGSPAEIQANASVIAGYLGESA